MELYYGESEEEEEQVSRAIAEGLFKVIVTRGWCFLVVCPPPSSLTHFLSLITGDSQACRDSACC